MALLTKILGDPTKSELSRHRRVVERINALEPTVAALSDEALRARADEFRVRLGTADKDLSFGQAYTGGLDDDDAARAAVRRQQQAEETALQKSLDAILPEAFATVREVSKRVLGMRHYDVQLIGGIVLHEGKIAEMRTGEGKTLVATLALYLNALAGRGAHLVTVNDYLARRDAGWNAPLYHALGLSVAVIASDLSLVYDPEYLDDSHEDKRLQKLRPCSRRDAYAADITYATNNELGFDYLRDNMARTIEQCVQRRLHYAIVDEVDSILIDEARTPLIISGQGSEPTDRYYYYAQQIPRLVKEEDFIVDEKSRSVSLTDEGTAKIEQWTGLKNIFDIEHVAEAHQINKALLAHAVYLKDQHYIVRDGEVIIVDEFTGRTMPGRRWSDGLHQAIEAKEGVKVLQENITMATITFQNFFRIYAKLSGMTGTAVTESEEFDKIYKLVVVPIPTNRPMVRNDGSDQIYKTEDAKFKAVVKDVEERHGSGQPVLVGTTSIEKSERISRMLEKRGIAHDVLNAKQHEREASIVANAGQVGSVTIATNMAGRGTDIVLGDGVQDLGGLYIIGTERHESRRIDNQLRGRSGRQGDPGETRFFLSFEDDLMRVFGGERMQGVMDRLNFDDEDYIESRLVSRQIEGSQARVEGYNFDTRRNVVQFDDVMNRQREIVYGERRKILEGTDTRGNVMRMIEMVVAREVPGYLEARSSAGWDLDGLWVRMRQLAPLPESDSVDLNALGDSVEEVVETLTGEIQALYEEREEKFGGEILRMVEQSLMLQIIDTRWVEYLTQMDNLRENIGFQAYGQKDPIIEFKREAFETFLDLVAGIEEEIVRTLSFVEIQKVDPAAAAAAPPAAGAAIAPASPRSDRPGSGSQAGPDAVPPARPAAAAASAALAKATQRGGRNPFMTDGPAVRNVVESSSAGSRRVDGTGGGAAAGQVGTSATSDKPHKVGRNDPCPCQSGKKYKFCHGS